MTRRDIILHDIDLSAGPGLELGPLAAPILSKDEAQVQYVDHLNTEDLKRKYKTEPVDPEKIVGVDYVLGNSTLRQCVGDKKFKYVVAAHVIEHVPDTVRWLQDVASVLEPDGVLSLVIPDKRYTFDIARNESRPADILGAYIDQHERTPASNMYDFASEYRTGIDPVDLWQARNFDPAGSTHRYSPAEALNMCQRNAGGGEYVDAHCHVFTPYSFTEILRALIIHRLFDYEMTYLFETNENNLEFYVSLRRLTSNSDNTQRQLASLRSVNVPKRVPELQAQLVEMQAEVDRLRNELDALNSDIAGIYASKSWRMTRPLRVLSRRAKRI